MAGKLALTYRQDTPRARVIASKRLSNIVNIDEFRKVASGPELALSALLGEVGPLSAVLGVHPNYPNSVHPVHDLIAASLIARTTKGVPKFQETVSVGRLTSSAAIIGGPRASYHAAKIFGMSESPSSLGVELPVHFKFPGDPTQVSDPSLNRLSLIVDGRETTGEYFLLTGLPLGKRRLVNFSTLRSPEGTAADLIFGNERLLNALYIRTRSFASAGWQALFKVTVVKGQAVSVDTDFDVFQIRGVDFDSEKYPLNVPDFLIPESMVGPEVGAQLVGFLSAHVSRNYRFRVPDDLSNKERFPNRPFDMVPLERLDQDERDTIARIKEARTAIERLTPEGRRSPEIRRQLADLFHAAGATGDAPDSNPLLTEKGSLRTSALPPDLAEAKRKGNALSQQRYVSQLTPGQAERRRARRAKLQRQRRSKTKSNQNPKGFG